jgi:chromosome segregation ATPase
LEHLHKKRVAVEVEIQSTPVMTEQEAMAVTPTASCGIQSATEFSVSNDQTEEIYLCSLVERDLFMSEYEQLLIAAQLKDELLVSVDELKELLSIEQKRFEESISLSSVLASRACSESVQKSEEFCDTFMQAFAVSLSRFNDISAGTKRSVEKCVLLLNQTRDQLALSESQRANERSIYLRDLQESSTISKTFEEMWKETEEGWREWILDCESTWSALFAEKVESEYQLREELSATAESLQVAEARSEELDELLAAAQDRQADFEETIVDLREQVRVLGSAKSSSDVMALLEEKEKSLNAAMVEQNLRNQNWDALESELFKLRSEKISQETLRASLVSENEGLKGKNSELLDQNTVLGQELKVAQAQKANSSSDIGDLQESLVELRIKVAVSEAQVVEIQKHVSVLEHTVSSKQAEISFLKQELDAVRNAHENLKVSSQETIQELKAYAALESTRVAAAVEVAVEEERKTSEVAQKEVLQELSPSMRIQGEEFSLREKYDALQEKYDQLLQQWMEMLQSVHDEQEWVALHDDLKRKNDELSEIRDRFHSLEGADSEKEKKIHGLESDIASLKGRLGEATATIRAREESLLETEILLAKAEGEKAFLRESLDETGQRLFVAESRALALEEVLGSVRNATPEAKPVASEPANHSDKSTRLFSSASSVVSDRSSVLEFNKEITRVDSQLLDLRTRLRTRLNGERERGAVRGHLATELK